jgi:hypothetical protein
MSFTANVIRVLIASPSDLVEERKVAITTVYEWNAQHAEAESVVLLPVAWETHATPRSGVRTSLDCPPRPLQHTIALPQ